MTEPFSPHDGPVYMYVQVADHLAERIRIGDLAPGARLGSERETAAEYGVALNTVRKALRLLQDRGMVIIAAAKGTYITDPARWRDDQ